MDVVMGVNTRRLIVEAMQRKVANVHAKYRTVWGGNEVELKLDPETVMVNPLRKLQDMDSMDAAELVFYFENWCKLDLMLERPAPDSVEVFYFLTGDDWV